jgi:hypothetical protein
MVKRSEITIMGSLFSARIIKHQWVGVRMCPHYSNEANTFVLSLGHLYSLFWNT